MIPTPQAATARNVLRGIAVAGLAFGAGSIAAPRLGLRLVGIDAEGRGVGWMARLFGCRDLALCGALLRVAGEERVDATWLDMLAASQVGDIALTAGLWRAGGLSRRGLATVLLTAPPTLVAALLVRRALAEDGALV